MNTIRRVLLTSALCLLNANCFALENLRTVALTGDPAPGMAAGATFEDLFTFGPDFYTEPQIDADGHVAFSAISAGQFGYWSEGAGAMELVSKIGLPAPGTPTGVDFSYMFAYPVLDAHGRSYFWSHLSGEGISNLNDSGLWAGKAGALDLVLRSGSTAPGLAAGEVYSEGTSAPVTSVNSSGQIAVYGDILSEDPGTLVDGAIWKGDPQGLTLIARAGTQAPGTPSGTEFMYLSWAPALNSRAQVAFHATLSGPEVDSSNWSSIWSDSSGVVSLVARSGTQVPGMSAGTVFDTLSEFPLIADSGSVVFDAYLKGPNIHSGNRQGIWRSSPGGLELVMRTGDPALGIGSGTVFFENFTLITGLDVDGNVVFQSRMAGNGVDGTNDSGIWIARDGNYELLLREGDAAPGTEEGTEFSFAPFPVLNAAGQMAFLSQLRGALVSRSNDYGIWASNRIGVLHLIARTGDQLEVAPGDLRTISELRMWPSLGYDVSFGKAFNDLGQVAFGASFTDGTSGVFVSNLVAVPEPPAALLLTGTLLVFCSTGRAAKSAR